MPARRDESVVETIGGRAVADPYRWLEGDTDEVAAFVDEANATSRPVLDALPGRAAFTEVLHRLLSAPTRSCPFERGGAWYALHNDGADQPRLVRAGSFGELEAAHTLLDPTTLADDGTAAIVAVVPNDEGTLVAVAVAESGSDWRTIRVLDGVTGEDLGVRLEWTKWNPPVWLPGGRAFTFWAYPEPEGNALTDVMEAGELQSFDVDTRERATVWVPEDERTSGMQFADDDWFVLVTAKGIDRAAKIRVRRHDETELRLLVDGTGRWYPVAVRDGELFAHTVEDAPMGRLVAVDLVTGERRVVVEEGEYVLTEVTTTATGFVLHHLVEAQSRLTLAALDGTLGDELPVGDGVTVTDVAGGRDKSRIALATTRFSDRGDRHLATVDGGRLVEWETAPRPEGSVEVPSASRRVRTTSSDGAEVSAFVVEPEGQPDGPRPVLLWGYGGFDIPLVPEFRAIFGAWVAAGGTVVVANLRGGGEYGEEWRDAGTKERKQQVFDDLYAITEHLVDVRITTPAQLALHGRSNGGLLAGAALTQRPELWACVLPGVGVLDMLRYHKFTIGWAWVRDYGDPDEPGVAEYLLEYSPLHNVRQIEYPPTLITTADHDDRVVPAHSYKFAAELQHTGLGGPFLLSVDTKAGHGMGKPVSAQVAEFADQLAFAAHHTGLVPEVSR